jgi:hypothetical protein
MAAMETTLTVAALVAGLVLVAVMSLIERRPRKDLSPRLLPTALLMFAGALVAILAAAHLLTVLGIQVPRR